MLMMAEIISESLAKPNLLDPTRIDAIAQELQKCVKKDQLVKAKFILQGFKKEERAVVVNKTINGIAPLFIASQQGQVSFVNYLMDECNSDIEQRGVYEVPEDKSKHQVTPLWCAAVANKLEIVKLLVKRNADINAMSDTQSTPVRSACYMTNIEVVRYLVEYGADIHKPNVNGGTCLINSVQSVDLCRFLIEKGANVNAQDNSGNLALHYAIREGRADTVKLLMKSGSDPYIRNDFGDDAIQTASLRGYEDILEYLTTRIKPSLLKQIEAYELLGTNFVDERHDISKAIHFWRVAMDLRYSDVDNPVLKSNTLAPNPTYQNATEVSSMRELAAIADKPDELYMQALLIRERILGPDHKDTIFGLMYRGAVYADTHRYQRCVDLWKYAFQLRHDKKEALNHECLFTLQALCKLYWEIFEEHEAGFTNEQVQFSDILQVFEMAIQEIVAAQPIIQTRPIHIIQVQDFHTLLLLVLHFIHLMAKLPLSEEERFAFQKQVHGLLVMNVRGQQGESLLHLAVEPKSSSVTDEFYSFFPSLKVIATLLDCGADPNVVDNDGKHPFHYCAPYRIDADLAESIIDKLLSIGAHVDFRDYEGKIAGEELLKAGYRGLHLMSHVTLKCLAARTIKKCGIAYDGQVPSSLGPFIERH